MSQCGRKESREKRGKYVECIRVMSLQVPQAKTRHLVGDKNKPQRRKREAPSIVGWIIYPVLCVCMRGECPCSSPISEDRFIHSKS